MSSNLTGLTSADFDVVNTEQLFVNGVEITQNGGGGGGDSYVLPLASNGTRGGVQTGYTANDKNYAVQLSSEKMFVNVPWENTQLTLTGSDGIDVTNDTALSTKFDSAYSDSTTTIYDVGGIPAGTTFSDLKSLSLPGLIDKMFNPVLIPIKTNASTISSFSNLPSVVRFGDVYNTNVSFNINLGGISYQNGDTINQNNNDYLGEITSGNIVLFGQTSESLTINSSARSINAYSHSGFTFSPIFSTQITRTYTSSFTFDVDTYTLVDSNNNNFTDGSIPLPAQQQTIGTSGTYRTNTKSTVAVYEFQKGTSSGGFESANLSNNPASFTFSQDFTETSSNRHTIYIPSVYLQPNSYKIQKLNTVSNTYEDLASYQFDITTVSIDVGNLTGISYQKRAYNGILATAGDYKLVKT